jgi:hypothetical protein
MNNSVKKFFNYFFIIAITILILVPQIICFAGILNMEIMLYNKIMDRIADSNNAIVIETKDDIFTTTSSHSLAQMQEVDDFVSTKSEETIKNTIPTQPPTEIEPTEVTKPVKNKINNSNFNYHFSYDYLNQQQQNVIDEVFNYINNKNYRHQIIVQPGLDAEERKELYTYFALYFSDFEGNYNTLDGFCGENYTEFYLHEENISRLIDKKQSVDKDIDNILLTFDDGSNVEVANQIAYFISNKADFYYDKYSAHNILWENVGNCNGFALLFHTMCHRVGIECDLITGYANGEYHAWNRIKLEDGSYRYYDLSFYEYSENNVYIAAHTSPWEVVGINKYLY